MTPKKKGPQTYYRTAAPPGLGSGSTLRCTSQNLFLFKLYRPGGPRGWVCQAVVRDSPPAEGGREPDQITFFFTRTGSAPLGNWITDNGVAELYRA